ncbi:DNA mismatch repair protein MSH5 [Exophiala viscosa]|uniref:DNA mismatch repair protein MSH5 n=1 Tax=Exophiala viscosa TaxID=2486360 RepID=A0AAN6DPG6_9EURO|nr:DNA mismatch repair protein MSH5 [Exophiala viscosa]
MPSTSGRGRRWRGRSYNGRSRHPHATERSQFFRQQTQATRPTWTLQTPSVASSTTSASLPYRTKAQSERPQQNQRSQSARTPVSGDDFPDQVIMALDIGGKGKIGCAYYVAGEERLFCMEEVVLGGVDIIEKLRIDIQPTMVILSPRCVAMTEQSEGQIRRQTSLVDSESDQPPLPYDTEVRPRSEFYYEGGLNKLLSLPCDAYQENNGRFLVPGDLDFYEEDLRPDEIGLTAQRGRLLQTSTWLDLSNEISIGCAGAVIGHLQRRRSAAYLPDDPNASLALRILHFEMFSLRGVMLISAETLASLQIIQPEGYSNAVKQSVGASRAKDDMLIHTLFQHHARTPQGKTLVRRAFLRPSLDINEINRRLDFVSVFVRPENQPQRQKLSKSLGKVRNMRKTMTELHKGIESGKQNPNAFKHGVWSALLEFCYHTIDIADRLFEVIGADHLPLCMRAVEVLDRRSLRRIGQTINAVVDIDLTVEKLRTVVKRGVDERLDEVKDVYDGMEEILREQAIETARKIPSGVNFELDIVYFPHMGFHITVPLNETTGQPIYDGTNLGWQHSFTTARQAYFKDGAMREMDEDLGDLYAVICELEIEIAYKLAQKVLEEEQLLIAASDLCGELDCSLAFAHCAHEYKLTRPRMTHDNIIDIRGGRHLLQELCVPSYVPNDTFLVGGGGEDPDAPDGPCMLLLTGPNYSGKSVYQKQVALAVYLAQIGSFLPADSAIIGITDKIFTRITTKETVSKIQSAFMIDIQQVAIALNSCTRRSLVVIDEFGKGTDSCDGAGLAAGVFLHLLSLGPEAPKALVATHFHEIFDVGLFSDVKNISFAHMEVRVHEREDVSLIERQSDITYLYNLQPGRSALSYGTQCAAMNGIPEHIVERSYEVALLAREGKDLIAVCSAPSKDDVSELESAEVAAELFMARDFGEQMTDAELLSTLDTMLEWVPGDIEELGI